MLKNALRFFGINISKWERRKNIFINKSAWEHQEKIISLKYIDGMIVVDIGSGGSPSPIANILTDFFPDDSIHRSRPIDEGRPIVICSVEAMPFKERSFDFSICSHVLEHVPCPNKAAYEISRISKAGYIETPAYGKDILIGTGSMHQWQVVLNSNQLHFFPYTVKQKESHSNSPFMSIWSDEVYHPLQEYFWNHVDLFNVCYLWDKDINLLVHDERNKLIENFSRKKWHSVDNRKLSNMKSTLTDSEISLLEKCLVTPDGLSPMKYIEGAFINENGEIQYPNF